MPQPTTRVSSGQSECHPPCTRCEMNRGPTTYTPSNISSIDRAALMAVETVNGKETRDGEDRRDMVDTYSAGSSHQNFFNFVRWGSPSSYDHPGQVKYISLAKKPVDSWLTDASAFTSSVRSISSTARISSPSSMPASSGVCSAST